MSHSNQRLIARGVATLLVGVALLFFLYSIRGALLIVYVSGLLALGVSPMIRAVERQRLIGVAGLPRWAAILLVYFGLLAILALILVVVLPPLMGQAAQLWQELPAYSTQFQRLLARYRLLQHPLTVGEVLPAPSVAIPALFGVLQGAFGTVGTAVVIVVLPYYLLIEADSLQDGLMKLFPAERRAWAGRVTDAVTTKVGAWLNGQLLLSAIVGAGTSTGLWLFGLPYFYVLGLLAGLSEFAPIVGPIVAAMLTIAIALTISVQKAIFVAVYFTAQQLFVGNVLIPRVMERRVGVSAWTVVVALLIGSELLGAVGAILAVPSAAIVQVFLHEYLSRDEE